MKEVETQGGMAIARGVLKSGRGGFVVGIGLAPQSGVQSIRVDGQEAVGADRLKSKDPTFVQFWGLRSREVPMEISFDAATVPKAILFGAHRCPIRRKGARWSSPGRRRSPAYSGDSALVWSRLI